MSAKQFALEIDEEFAEIVERGLVQAVQTIAFELHERIVMKTPVDTGAARAAWNASIGSPEYVQRGTTAAVAGMSEPLVVWITNAMEYASALENGHSQQAPAGMVALSIAEIETKYSRMQ